MSTARTIAKNTSFLVISQVINMVIVLIYITYTARYLGPGGFGVISAGLAFANLFVYLSDLGLTTLTVRDVSRNKSLSDKYFTNVGVMRLGLSVITFALIAISVNLLGYSQQTIIVVYISALSTLFYALCGIFNSIFQSFEKMEYQSLGLVFNSLVLLAGSYLGVTSHFDIYAFASIGMVANFLLLAYCFFVYVFIFSRPRIQIEPAFWKPALVEAFPYGIRTIFQTIYYSADAVLLQYILGNTVAGWYTAAYRLIRYLVFIPTVTSTAIFPVMSRLHLSSEDMLRLLNRKYVKYMIIMAIPMGVGTTMLADKIIWTIFGEGYGPSIEALQLLIWSMVFVFISTAFVQLFDSTGRQRMVTTITGIGMVLDIALNLMLIPFLSFVGSSIAVCVTEFFILVFVFRSARVLGYVTRIDELARTLARAVIASLAMGAFLWYFTFLNLIVLVVIAIPLYFVVLCLLKGIDNEDVALLRSIVKGG